MSTSETPQTQILQAGGVRSQCGRSFTMAGCVSLTQPRRAELVPGLSLTQDPFVEQVFRTPVSMPAPCMGNVDMPNSVRIVGGIGTKAR